MPGGTSKIFPQVDNARDDSDQSEHHQRQEDGIGAGRWVLEKSELVVDHSATDGRCPPPINWTVMKSPITSVIDGNKLDVRCRRTRHLLVIDAHRRYLECLGSQGLGDPHLPVHNKLISEFCI